MKRFAGPHLLVAAAVLSSSCSTTSKRKDDWDRYRIKFEKDTSSKPPVLGKGLEGRMVGGERIYTVQVEYLVSKEGKVVHAVVHRSDAPEKLQWATVKGVKRFQFGPQKRPFKTRQTFIFKGLEVTPD